MWSLAAILAGELTEASSRTEIESLETAAQWCQSYILQGHPGLGRAGPVCPWCPPSVARGHFYLMHAYVRYSDEAAVVTELYRIRDQYLKMSPVSGPDISLKTVLFVMSFENSEPDPNELRQWMLRIHAAAKPGFLKKGLMLGEFFPDHAATGLRNDAFYPLQSPLPLFVIRAMVPLDITFLSERREYAEAYVAKFAEDWPKHLRDILNIAPKRFARSRLRSLLRCLSWYKLQRASVEGKDLITGALLKDLGQSRLQQILDEDRTFRPLVTTVVFQPLGLGKSVESGSIEYLEWLWRTAHALRRAAGTEDFIYRDGDRLVAVLLASNPIDIDRIVQLGESLSNADGIAETLSGRATEGVLQSCAEEWEWDGTERTSWPSLLERAYTDLLRRERISDQSTGTVAAVKYTGNES